MRLRFHVSCVNIEDKSGFSAFQVILFTSLHFQLEAYTRFNISSIGSVKSWDKIEIANFADLSPLCPSFILGFNPLKSVGLAKYVRDFKLSSKLTLNHLNMFGCA